MSVIPIDPVRDLTNRILKGALAIALIAAISVLSIYGYNTAQGFFVSLGRLLGGMLA